MTIRRASINDIEDMVALHKAGFDVAWDLATFLDLLNNDLIWVVTGATQNNLAGFIVVRHILDEAEVITLVVARNAQGKGVGSALLASAVDHLLMRRVTQVFLEVAKDNLSAIALYLRAGFVQIAERRAYYRRKAEPNVDALVLSLRPDYTHIVANN